MTGVEFFLAALALIGVLWVVLLLTNDEYERFGAWEEDEIEARHEFEAAMKRHPAGRKR